MEFYDFRFKSVISDEAYGISRVSDPPGVTIFPSYIYAPINCNPQYGIHRGFIRGFTNKLPPVVGLLTQAFFITIDLCSCI